MSWIICLIIFSVSLLLIGRWRFFKEADVSFKWLTTAFVVKVLAGIFFIWLYSNHYTNRNESDVFKYFDDGVILHQVAANNFGDFAHLFLGYGKNLEELSVKYLGDTRFWDRSPSLPFINDNRLIIRYNALVMFISCGNIYVHLLLAVLLAFIGLNFFFLFLRQFFVGRDLLLFFAVFFTPSMVFWTSSVLKENFMLLGIGMLLYFANKKPLSLKHITLIFLSLFLITQSKLYVLLTLIPPFIAFFWNRGMQDGKTWYRYLVINLLLISVALSIGLYVPSLDMVKVLSFKQSEFKCLADWTGAGSQVYIPDLDNSYYSFLKASPYALYNTLFRPLPWDGLNALSLPAMAEILLIWSFVIIGCLFRRKLNYLEKNFLLFTGNYILLLALLIGWTTPVMGAVVRYRIVLLPLILSFPLIMTDWKKLAKFAGINYRP